MMNHFRMTRALDATKFWLLTYVVWLGASVAASESAFGQAQGSVYIDVVDQESDEPLHFRVQVRNARDQVVRARGVQVVDSWSLIDGSMHFRGNPGDYSYRVFRGPEYSSGSGNFTLDKNADNADKLRLKRYADLASEGWYGGDLGSRVPIDKTTPWLMAEGLHMAASILAVPQIASDAAEEQIVEPESAGENTNAMLPLDGRWGEQLAYEDARQGSGLVIHHWQPPAEVPASLASARLLVLARASSADERQPDRLAHAEITRLWSRDLPIWLASGRVDSIQLLGEHLTYDGKRGLSVKPRVPIDAGMSEGRGPGRIVEKLYWKILDAGLRIPPTAGSGFGEHGSPLGYNRVVAYCEQSIAPERWWQAVREGKTFVTNGPLLRVQVNGNVPGHVFSVRAGEDLGLEVALQLTASDPVEYLDVIFNGKTLYQARLDEFAQQGGRIPILKVNESGWLVVRVVTELDHTYRLATTAPFYVEVDGQPRISRGAVEFFREWLRLVQTEMQVTGGESWQQAKPFLEASSKFWGDRLVQANAD